MTHSNNQVQNQAGLSAYFAITTSWGLTAHQQRVLLGNPTSEAFREWKQHRHGILRPEHKSRILKILKIYRALNALYSKKNAKRWLTINNPNRVFQSKTPLELMLSGDDSALSDILTYLDWVNE